MKDNTKDTMARNIFNTVYASKTRLNMFAYEETGNMDSDIMKIMEPIDISNLVYGKIREYERRN